MLTSIAKFKELKIIEQCLAIEFGIWQEDALVKEKAKKLARNMIHKIQVKIDEQYNEEDQRQYTMLIDGILEMQNENKPKIDIK